MNCLVGTVILFEASLRAEKGILSVLFADGTGEVAGDFVFAPVGGTNSLDGISSHGAVVA